MDSWMTFNIPVKNMHKIREYLMNKEKDSIRKYEKGYASYLFKGGKFARVDSHKKILDTLDLNDDTIRDLRNILNGKN